MTILEFWGCALIAFGPALAMFSLTVAHDPVKIILLISSSFFWLISFLVVAICWALINTFCDYLIIGAYIAVLSQESFRYLFHIAIKRAQLYMDKIINSSNNENIHSNGTGAGHANKNVPSSSRATNEIQMNNNNNNCSTIDEEFHDRIPISYVSGLGFGLMNAAFSLMNVLTDYIGPGTVGIKGDSTYFLLVSALTALAFILLNVSWSILMSECIEKSDRRLLMVILASHILATTITFLNRAHLQLISLLVVYALAIFCGIGAFQVAGFNLNRLFCDFRSRRSSASVYD